MKTKISSITAMTLTELLTATVLVGIVMAGIISVDFALRNMRSSSGKMGNAASRTSSAMMRLTRDAENTMGDSSNTNNVNNTTNTVGIFWDALTNPKEICFRYDPKALDNNVATTPTPEDYTDDRWSCYFHRTGGNQPLYRCTNLTIPLPTAETQCTNEVLLDNLTDDDFFTVTPAYGPIQYIDFTLRYCSTIGACHSINNPEILQQSRITFTGISRY